MYREPLIQSQERSARDFVPGWGLKIAGILYVFQDFRTNKLGPKARWAPQPIDSEVPKIPMDESNEDELEYLDEDDSEAVEDSQE